MNDVIISVDELKLLVASLAEYYKVQEREALREHNVGRTCFANLVCETWNAFNTTLEGVVKDDVASVTCRALTKDFATVCRKALQHSRGKCEDSDLRNRLMQLREKFHISYY